MRTAARPVRLAQATRSKYRAKRTTVDGRTFHSRAEAARYSELRILQQADRIRNLICQPRYGLYIRPFLRPGIDPAELIKVGDWYGDFQYDELVDGRWVQVVEDTKGMATLPLAKLKQKIVEALYGFTVREIR